MLKEKLNDDQKTQLKWLKEALGDDGEFNKFLGNNEDKIRTALDHIKSELDSCTGDNVDQKKSTFKETVKGFFSGGDINNITTDVSSTCKVQ